MNLQLRIQTALVGDQIAWGRQVDSNNNPWQEVKEHAGSAAILRKIAGRAHAYLPAIRLMAQRFWVAEYDRR